MKEFFDTLLNSKKIKKTVLITVLTLLIINSIFYFFVDIDESLIFEYYTTGYFAFITSIQQVIFRIFPFSFGDFIYIFIFFLFIFITARIIRKLYLKQYSDLLWATVDLVSLVLFILLGLSIQWNWNYRQPKINEKLNFEIVEYDIEELAAFTETVLQKAIETKEFTNFEVFEGNFGSLVDIAPLGYDEMAKQDEFYNYKNSCVKESLFSFILPYMGISGYYNPFTSEAQITQNIPIVQGAFVINHEIAHQLGIASESEANFVAYLSTIKNPLSTIQYTGHMVLLYYCLRDLEKNNYRYYEDLYKTIPENIIEDINKINVYWYFFVNEYSKYTDKIYDMFLKSNSQKYGIRSYNRIVTLALSHQKHENNEK